MKVRTTYFPIEGLWSFAIWDDREMLYQSELLYLLQENAEAAGQEWILNSYNAQLKYNTGE